LEESGARSGRRLPTANSASGIGRYHPDGRMEGAGFRTPTEVTAQVSAHESG
jgi:hypothetical protein